MYNSIEILGCIASIVALLQILYFIRFHLPRARAASLHNATSAARQAYSIVERAGSPDAVMYHDRLRGIEAQACQLLRQLARNGSGLWSEYMGFFAGQSWRLYVCSREAARLQRDIENELRTHTRIMV